MAVKKQTQQRKILNGQSLEVVEQFYDILGARGAASGLLGWIRNGLSKLGIYYT